MRSTCGGSPVGARRGPPREKGGTDGNQGQPSGPSSPRRGIREIGGYETMVLFVLCAKAGRESGGKGGGV